MPVLIALLQLAAGFVLLIWSADRLVAGASAIARNLGVSTLLVGLTIVGFGTSAPEMLVSALASYNGNPSLAIGNALGSNIANVALILGLTAMVYPLCIERNALKREFPVLGVIMVLALGLMINGSLSRLDGAILILGLFTLVTLMVLWGSKALKSAEPDPVTEALMAEIPESMPTKRAVVWTAISLVLLPFSAQILVDGAVDLALILGVSDAVVGLTIVALGTSLPELAAALAAAMKGEDDLCIGNILGSNMFNLLGVLGIAALVHPMGIESILLVRDVPVMFLTFAMLAGLAIFHPRIGRPAAIGLFLTYLVYQGAVIWQAMAA